MKIIGLILLLFIFCSRQELNQLKYTLENVRSISVYDKSIDDYLNENEWDTTGIDTIKAGEFKSSIIQQIVKKINFTRGFPLWKGGWLAIVTLTNNEKLLTVISIYGSFFMIKGTKGCFYFDGTEADLFKKELDSILLSHYGYPLK